MRVLILRHGQSKGNTGETDYYDSDLTERGELQKEESALHIKEVLGLTYPDFENNFIGFVSPYLRTLKTAEPIYKRFNIKFIVDPRIGEYPDEHQKQLKFDKMMRNSTFNQFDWGKFPKEGIDWKVRTLEEYHENLLQFTKELPEDSIIVTHMTVVSDLVKLLSNGKPPFPLVTNASLTYIEDNYLVFMGKR